MILMQVSVLFLASPYCALASVPVVSLTSAVISTALCCVPAMSPTFSGTEVPHLGMYVSHVRCVTLSLQTFKARNLTFPALVHLSKPGAAAAGMRRILSGAQPSRES